MITLLLHALWSSAHRNGGSGWGGIGHWEPPTAAEVEAGAAGAGEVAVFHALVLNLGPPAGETLRPGIATAHHPGP